MEYRRLGLSGLKVPVLSFGAGTFVGATAPQRVEPANHIVAHALTYPAAVGVSAPAGFYRLGESSGTVAADSAGSTPGTAVTAASSDSSPSAT